MKEEKVIQQASEMINEEFEEITYEEYLKLLEENPLIESNSAKYLLEAIKHTGTRKVIESGKELERYRFFDDPYNNGENAILGNTDILNEFVDSIEEISRSRKRKIIWINGSTATGKSEFKRCLINGLKGFSKTEKGKRYTMEWNISKHKTNHSMSQKDEWYKSPVRSTPLTILPNESKQYLKNNISSSDINFERKLDPFCKETFKYLAEEYKGNKDVFRKIVSKDHLRIKRFTYDIGNGIGLLTSEDTGKPKQKLVGNWIPSLLKEIGSRGKKNPQAFSYSGLLSQGNNGVSIIEDASMHSDVLQNLLNIIDEDRVKIGRSQYFDLDTVMIIISNPDLEMSLDQKEELRDKDPLKALKRRMEKHNFRYLTNYSLESELLKKEITGEYNIKNKESDSNKIEVSNSSGKVELAPHTIKAASLYNIISRLDKDNIKSNKFDIIDKTEVFDKGKIVRNGDEYDLEDIVEDDRKEGLQGIPVTYSRDIISDTILDPPERYINGQKINNIITPIDIITKMKKEFSETPMFNEDETKEYRKLYDDVLEKVINDHKNEILMAMVGDVDISEDEISKYINNVYKEYDYNENESEEIDETDIDYLYMKVFETEKLGKFSKDNYYKSHKGKKEVKQFRKEHIINAINNIIWSKKEENYSVEDVPLEEIPIFEKLLGKYSWEDVMRKYEDLDMSKWDNPPEDTVTEEVKEKTVENMVDDFGYSEESAKIVIKQVLEKGDNKWV